MDSPLCSLCAGSHSARWTLTFQASQPSLRNQAWLSLLRHVPLSWDISLYSRLYRFLRRFSRCLENLFENFWWKVGLFLVTFSILTVLLPLCPHPPRRPCPFRVFRPESHEICFLSCIKLPEPGYPVDGASPAAQKSRGTRIRFLCLFLVLSGIIGPYGMPPPPARSRARCPPHSVRRFRRPSSWPVRRAAHHAAADRQHSRSFHTRGTAVRRASPPPGSQTEVPCPSLRPADRHPSVSIR